METTHQASRAGARRTRTAGVVAAGAVVAFALALTPQVLATDIADIGIIDQQAIGNLAPFQSANAQFSQIRAQMSAQFQAAIKGKTPAQQQAISSDFNTRLTTMQHQLFDPLIGRANAAIAQVAANRSLSVVVDKQIVIFGGLDVTKDVTDLLSQPGQIVPPVNTPAPSKIGYVDRTKLDTLPKLKAAADTFGQFQSQLGSQFGPQLKPNMPADQRQKIVAQYQQQLQDERTKVLQPVVDLTDKAIANVARSKGLLLVINSENRVFGGTDVTDDVVKALQ